MNVEITSAGAESSDIALKFFKAHCTVVFRQVRDHYGIVYDVEEAQEHDKAELPRFFPPSGRMLIARSAGRPIGIGCLATIGKEIGEVKRVFVSPDSRGGGVGRRLMEALIREARAMGHVKLRLDSGRLQTVAHSLYRSLGFVEIPRYAESQIPEADSHIVLFMEMRL